MDLCAAPDFSDILLSDYKLAGMWWAGGVEGGEVSCEKVNSSGSWADFPPPPLRSCRLHWESEDRNK